MDGVMDFELFDALEKRITALLDRFDELQRENECLRGENRSLLAERQELKTRVDAILAKLERI
jgi:cell division protein ZapB